jgi:hypothetical protein
MLAVPVGEDPEHLHRTAPTTDAITIPIENR